MSSYVLSFRTDKGHVPSPEEEKAWMAWFDAIGANISDFGHRVSDTRVVGSPSTGSSDLSGYVVIDAKDLDDAAHLAEGCPGLAAGGSVEVGQTCES